jgi:ABC-type arginine transport system permease subunit
VAGVYTTLMRGVPDLVLMLLVFYGGQMLVNRSPSAQGWDYIDIDPFIAGVLTIGFIFGAYLTEAFRGAFLAVPAGQREAGLAYGMSRPGAVAHHAAADAAPRCRASPTTGWC